MADALGALCIKLKWILCQNEHSQGLPSIFLWQKRARLFLETDVIPPWPFPHQLAHAVTKRVMHRCRSQRAARTRQAPQFFLFWTNAECFLFLLLFQVTRSCSANKQSQQVWLMSLFGGGRTAFLLLPAPSHSCFIPHSNTGEAVPIQQPRTDSQVTFLVL